MNNTNLHITSIYGNSTSGKTFLAKKLFGSRKYVYVDMETILTDYNLDQYIDFKTLLRGKPEILFSKLSAVDKQITNVLIRKQDDEVFIEAELHGEDERVRFNQLSSKYRKILYLIMLIRSKQNLVIDNLDMLNIGTGFNKILELIIREIVNSKLNVSVTFTDIGLWQLFCLLIPKDVHKKFIMTKYDNGEFEHMEIDYLKLAYTVNYIVDKQVRAADAENRQVRASDAYL